MFTAAEWRKIQEMANLPPPPPDRSNKYAVSDAAATLGQMFYFDTGFSGTSTLRDMVGRDVPEDVARAPRGQPANIGCMTCHDPARSGVDHTSKAKVSIGVGAYDVSAQPTVNAAYFDLLYWNGRNDSLWAQILAVGESGVSMGGNRLTVAWRIADAYREDYAKVFVDHPLPLEEKISDLKQRLSSDGQCQLVSGACPAEVCAEDKAPDGSMTGCWPRFPLRGRPGSKAGCQRGDSAEPFGDAFDCMAAEDRDAITRVYVNFAKAIAAYEYRLTSRNAPFDRFVNEGQGSQAIPVAAKRGLKLFVGKATCVECHGTPLLSDNKFHNIGVAQQGPFVPTEADCSAGKSCDCTVGKNCLPWGFRDGLAKLKASGFRRDSKWSDDSSDDSRAKYYTMETTDALKGQWRTPGLRDVAETAPYLHTGNMQTLADVIKFYNEGGRDLTGTLIGERDEKIKELNLSDAEMADLEAFLRTLTGERLPAALTTAPPLPAASAF